MSSRAFVTKMGGDYVTSVTESCTLGAQRWSTVCCMNVTLYKHCPPGLCGTGGQDQGKQGERERNQGNPAVLRPSTWDRRAGGQLDGNLPSRVSLTMRAINTKRVNGG